MLRASEPSALIPDLSPRDRLHRPQLMSPGQVGQITTAPSYITPVDARGRSRRRRARCVARNVRWWHGSWRWRTRD